MQRDTQDAHTGAQGGVEPLGRAEAGEVRDGRGFKAKTTKWRKRETPALGAAPSQEKGFR
jgi:hypothetical protein